MDFWLRRRKNGTGRVPRPAGQRRIGLKRAAGGANFAGKRKLEEHEMEGMQGAEVERDEDLWPWEEGVTWEELQAAAAALEETL